MESRISVDENGCFFLYPEQMSTKNPTSGFPVVFFFRNDPKQPEKTTESEANIFFRLLPGNREKRFHAREARRIVKKQE
jgi:hypothetical protein